MLPGPGVTASRRVDNWTPRYSALLSPPGSPPSFSLPPPFTRVYSSAGEARNIAAGCLNPVAGGPAAGWPGGRHFVSRRGKSKKVPRLSLTVAAGVQPVKLHRRCVQRVTLNNRPWRLFRRVLCVRGLGWSINLPLR